MALVRISKDLLSDVSEVISQMERDELTQLASNASSSSALEMYNAAMEAAWVAAPHLKAVFPSAWVRTFEGVDIHICKGETKQYHFYNTVTNKDAGMGKYELPHNFGSDYRPDIYVPESIWSKYPSIASRVASVVKCDELRQSVSEKYNGVKIKIKSFLRGCKSLNDAVKKWEGIKLYIPQKYLNDLERVVVRTPREKEVVEDTVPVDVEELTALGAMHRIMGSAS